MWAARKGRTEVVSLLLEAGANTDLQNKVKCRCDLGILLYIHMFFITQDGESALTIAAREGRTEVVTLLMKTVILDPQQNKVY